ncbi:MAG: PTS glucose transporter subunit IIA [Clostridia bacterium]|nr:PTS glucose transporter subunit IIA [Clostridia bacterium]
MLFAKKQKSFYSVCNGKSIPLSEMPDEAMAQGLLGVGFAVEPWDGLICSPVDGRVETVAESKHAYSILTDDGLEILVHIGVDTVGLKGEGFLPRVREGDYVKAGDPIAEADLEIIRAHALSPTVAVIVTNPERMERVEYHFGESKLGTSVVMLCRVCRKG